MLASGSRVRASHFRALRSGSWRTQAPPQPRWTLRCCYAARETAQPKRTKRRQQSARSPCSSTEKRACVRLALSCIAQWWPAGARRSTYRFHLVADELSKRVLAQELVGLQAHFYDIEAAEPAAAALRRTVRWAPGFDWADRFRCGLYKALLPIILPKAVVAVLVLDADVYTLADVSELWLHFPRFSPSQFLGMAEEQSTFYRRYAPDMPLPTDLGLNSGVMLMNLTRMRTFDWADRLLVAAHAHRIRLADQDLFNLMVVQHPEVLFVLPCSWNLQVGGLVRAACPRRH